VRTLGGGGKSSDVRRERLYVNWGGLGLVGVVDGVKSANGLD
jgi:hypothetical protein